MDKSFAVKLVGLALIYATGVSAGLIVGHVFPSWVTYPNIILAVFGGHLAVRE